MVDNVKCPICDNEQEVPIKIDEEKYHCPTCDEIFFKRKDVA